MEQLHLVIVNDGCLFGVHIGVFFEVVWGFVRGGCCCGGGDRVSGAFVVVGVIVEVVEAKRGEFGINVEVIVGEVLGAGRRRLLAVRFWRAGREGLRLLVAIRAGIKVDFSWRRSHSSKGVEVADLKVRLEKGCQ